MAVHFFICPRCGFRDLINVPDENTRPRLHCHGKCSRVSTKISDTTPTLVDLDMTEVSRERYDHATV